MSTCVWHILTVAMLVAAAALEQRPHMPEPQTRPETRATSAEAFPLVVVNVFVDSTHHSVFFPGPTRGSKAGESVHETVTRLSEHVNLADWQATMLQIEAHRLIAKRLEFNLKNNKHLAAERSVRSQRWERQSPRPTSWALPFPPWDRVYPFSVNVIAPLDLDCIDGYDNRGGDFDTIPINFELAEREGNGSASSVAFPSSVVERCVILFVSGLRNSTFCSKYEHGNVKTLEASNTGEGAVIMWLFFRIQRTKEIIAHSPPIHILVKKSCIENQKEAPLYVQGYCEPELACPTDLPIAYLGSPRSGSTMLKRMIVNDLEGGNFISHTSQNLQCCNSERSDSISGRLPIFVARNPYTRALSTFFHGWANPFLIPEENDGLYLELHGVFGEKWIPKFEKWLRFTLAAFPTDDVDSTNHIKSQVGHFHSPSLGGKPHNISNFHILHLETIEEDWQEMEQLMCNKRYMDREINDKSGKFGADDGACESRCRPSAGAKKRVKHHDLSALAKRPDLIRMIQERYKEDFEAFGYSTDVNQPLPLLYGLGSERRRRSRVPKNITIRKLCERQVPFYGSSCAAAFGNG